MKLKFKIQPFQTRAVESVVDCFAGQVNASGAAYRVDPGVIRIKSGEEQTTYTEIQGFRNADIQLTRERLLENVRSVQMRRNLPKRQKQRMRQMRLK